MSSKPSFYEIRTHARDSLEEFFYETVDSDALDLAKSFASNGFNGSVELKGEVYEYGVDIFGNFYTIIGNKAHVSTLDIHNFTSLCVGLVTDIPMV